MRRFLALSAVLVAASCTGYTGVEVLVVTRTVANP